MISLRSKLWLGGGGLLAILALVTVLSILALNRYSEELDRVFKENYNSAVYCDAMKRSLDHLNTRALRELWNQPADEFDPNAEFKAFDVNLHRQIGNVTLPGEGDLTHHLADLWNQYHGDYQAFESTPAARQQLYHTQLLPDYDQLNQIAQRIADINMANMISVDGQVKHIFWTIRGVLLGLLITGIIVGVAFVGGVGASVLSSIRVLMRSARELEQGNLDHVANVRSRDEIGQLGQAFNSMAARLREYRKLDLQQRQRIQKTTQLAIDSLPDGVFVIGPNSEIEIANRTAVIHLNITPGKTVAELSLRWLTPIYQRVLAERLPVAASDYRQAIQLFDNGAERFLLPRAVPMLDSGGEMIGVTVILSDVTNLRHADELKSGLLATVSHELRTPLTSIRMGILMLDQGTLGPLTNAQQKSVASTREEAERLYRIIENLLSMSRIESGQAHFQFVPMSAKEIVSLALEPLGNRFQEKNVRLDINVAEGEAVVMADPSCIGLALGNLLSNALKFTPKGGAVTVAVETSENPDEIVFTVCDTGPGVGPEYAERIFEKFFRVAGREGPSGAGLGLAIAREIAAAHGGQIYLRGGQGSTFVLSLPRNAPNIVENSSEAACAKSA
jgi:signal transduction histidine kinase/HAMP domain-containing protein